MGDKTVFVHVNIVARDWQKLAAFYTDVFECTPRYPERDLHGGWIDKATGLKNVHIRGIHLLLPGSNEGPTLEIFQYDKWDKNGPRHINSPGIAHIAFQVEDVTAYTGKILKNGGSQLGRVTTKQIESAGTITFSYCRDPEGNIIELQSWDKEK